MRWGMSVIRILIVILLAALTGVTNAQPQTELPNFDQTNTVYPTAVHDHDDESIDPYLGGLTLKQTDLRLPGPGGFDLDVVRAYNSARVAREGLAENDSYTPKPLGWTVHFGRMLVRYRVCSGSINTNEMPLLETPDGQRRLVWGVSQTGSPVMMTQDLWSVICSGAGYLVTSPDGTRYDMQFMETTGTTTCPNAV